MAEFSSFFVAYQAIVKTTCLPTTFRPPPSELCFVDAFRGATRGTPRSFDFGKVVAAYVGCALQAVRSIALPNEMAVKVQVPDSKARPRCGRQASRGVGGRSGHPQANAQDTKAMLTMEPIVPSMPDPS